MSNIQQRMEKIGLGWPEILLPAKAVKYAKWSVIACDQFTSDKAYWQATENTVGDAPSTLNLILPEAYLEDGQTESRVESINDTMEQYLADGLLQPAGPGLVLVDRSTSFVPSRKGLVLTVDLENYSFEQGAKALIRPTEGTVLDRLPPRMDIRRGASLDLPHILLLIDDPAGAVIESLYEQRDQMTQLYDFDLQQDGGHIAGWLVDESKLESAVTALEQLAASGLLFAVGDGNHSLAAAKQLWEEKKSQGAPADDPARYALVEVENIHDAGLLFHPIHRVLFGVDQADLLEAMAKQLGGGFVEGPTAAKNPAGNEHTIGMVTPGKQGVLNFTQPASKLTVEYVQAFLDEYLAAHPAVTIDYIHDDQPVRDLGSQPGNVGIYLPPVDKDVFFDRIRTVGPYPRKTFSIGEAPEKRYYLEARKLVK